MEERELGLGHWRTLAQASDPLATDEGRALLEAIRHAQNAASAGDREAMKLLAACYLVAASTPSSAATPLDGVMRFAGYAATAINRLGAAEEQSALLVWFRRTRGRMRGSIFVPRDVEAAFAGAKDVLAPAALDPTNHERIRKSLEALIAEARRAIATETEPRPSRLPWRVADLESLRLVTTELSMRESSEDSTPS